MTSCIDNEMEDREYCPLSPERILFLTTAKTLQKTEKLLNYSNKMEKTKIMKWSWKWSACRCAPLHV